MDVSDAGLSGWTSGGGNVVGIGANEYGSRKILFHQFANRIGELALILIGVNPHRLPNLPEI